MKVKENIVFEENLLITDVFARKKVYYTKNDKKLTPLTKIQTMI